MRFPTALTDLDQWIYWKYSWDEKRRDWTKVPCDENGVPRSVKDPKSWRSFGAVLEYFDGAWPSNPKPPASFEHAAPVIGGGFCFAEGGGIVALDIDYCLPNLSPQAREILSRFQTYAEVSPSGQGIKLIGYGTKPEGSASATTEVEGFKKLECYDHARFFTMTGNLFGVELELQDVQEATNWLCGQYFAPKDEKPLQRQTISVSQNASSLLEQAHGYEGTDDELIAFLREDPKYDRLWLGDGSDYPDGQGEPDWSRADAALMEKIAWIAGPVPERIIRVFGLSALADRPKWKREDYRRRTLESVLSDKTDFYRGGGGAPQESLPEEIKPYVLVNLADVESTRIAWWVEHFVPKGMAMVLSSAGGVIKGLYTMWLAANHIDGPVLYLGSEDNLSAIIKPRAEAAGVSFDRFIPLREVNVRAPDGEIVQIPIRFPKHAAHLEQAINDTGAKIVVIDAGPEHMEEGLKNNSTEDIRRFMNPLYSIAERLNVTILIILHTNKTQGASGTDRVGGSRTWVDAQRHVLLAAFDDEDADLRHVEVAKTNVGKIGVGRQFRVKTRMVRVRDRETGEWGEDTAPYIEDAGESYKSVDELIAAKVKSKGDEKTDLAILEYLQTNGRTESDALDAYVSTKLSLATRTVRNHRMGLGRRNLVQAIPEEDYESGQIKKWHSEITVDGLLYLEGFPDEEEPDA